MHAHGSSIYVKIAHLLMLSSEHTFVSTIYFQMDVVKGITLQSQICNKPETGYHTFRCRRFDSAVQFISIFDTGICT